jgi:hypothetical protein
MRSMIDATATRSLRRRVPPWGRRLLLLVAFSAPAVAYVDDDSDRVQQADDNCLNSANSDQADVDLDGFGNPCDADCTGDAFVGGPDFVRLGMEFGTTATLIHPSLALATSTAMVLSAARTLLSSACPSASPLDRARSRARTRRPSTIRAFRLSRSSTR